MLATALWALRRRRWIDAGALSRARCSPTSPCTSPRPPTTGRGRPARSSTRCSRPIPPGHAAYSVALIACATVLVRAGVGWAVRFAVADRRGGARRRSSRSAASTCARTTSPTCSAASRWGSRSGRSSGIAALFAGAVRHNDAAIVSNDDQITYAVAGAAALVSLVAWIALIVIPAWSSYWRLRERILAVVMSVYILAAFVGMGACAGAVFLYYYDRSKSATRLRSVTPPAQDAAAAAVDLGSLAAISDAVESGLGLPEVVRAAARALDASLVLIDRSSSVLAVAARSTADERALMADAPGVVRARAASRRRGRRPAAPARAHGRAAGRLPARRDHADRLRGRAPARARPRLRGRAGRVRGGDHAPQGHRPRRHRRPWQRARAGPVGRRRRRGRARAPLRARRRRLARPGPVRRRARRAVERPGLAGRAAGGPGRRQLAGRGAAARRPRRRASRRVAEAVSRELSAACTASPSRSATRASRHDPVDLYRAGHEALLAANVAEARPGRGRRRRSPRSPSRTRAPTGCCCPR